MLGKNYYHRSFIIFQSRDKGCSFESGKEPAGYCKLEIKGDRGKAYIYVQDIKAADEINGMYEIILVPGRGMQIPQSLGVLEVDKRGRGERIIEFNPYDIGASGKGLDEFHAIAIVLINRENSGLISIKFPLVGYADKGIEIDWTGRVTNAIRESVKTDGSIWQNRAYKGEEFESYSNLKKMDNTNKDNTMQEESATGSGHEVDGAREGITSTLAVEEISDIEDERDILDTQINDVISNIRDESDKELLEDDTKIYDSWIQLEKVDGEEGIGGKESIQSEVLQEHYEQRGKEEDIYVDELDGDNENIDGDKKNIAKTKSDMDEISENTDKTEIDGNRINKDMDKNRKDINEISKNTDRIGEDVEHVISDQDYEEEVMDRGFRLEFDSTKLEYWDKVKDYFNGLMENYELIDPFDEYIEGSKWVKVPQFGAYYPYTYDSHYLVGLISEEGIMKYIVYGIPGPYASMPPRHLEGFYCWKPAKGMYGFGYWLLYIDAHTGEVLYPYYS